MDELHMISVHPSTKQTTSKGHLLMLSRRYVPSLFLLKTINTIILHVFVRFFLFSQLS